MAPLDGALALDERQTCRGVGEQLHLDVPRPLEATLEVDRGVAERRLRLRPRGANRDRQLGLRS